MLFKIGFLSISVIDVLDVALVSYIFYKIYEFLRGSIAARMMIGLLFIILISIIAEVFNMSGSTWIFANLKTVWVIAFVIIFQPEFRRLLLYLGQIPILRQIVQVSAKKIVEEVVSAVSELSRKNLIRVLLYTTGQW
jgi:diadenylate cyclase